MTLRSRLNRGGSNRPKRGDPPVRARMAARSSRSGGHHRDLKPETVPVHSPRSTKLVDSASLAVATRPVRNDLTHTGYFVGTTVYTTRATREKHLRSPLDLYSVGVILYESLTASCVSKTPSELTYNLALSSPRPLLVFRRSRSALGRVVLQRCAQSGERFQDAQS